MAERITTDRKVGIEELLPNLGGLPLALVQTGAYLGMTGLTVSEYLEHYEATWDELMRNQNQFPLQEYAERSCLTTWKISYDQVGKVNGLAARLLDLWAFLHRDDIWPELILAGGTEAAQRCFPGGEPMFLRATKLSLQHALGILAQYSMVQEGTSSQARSIHPVLHAWCLHNLEEPTAQNRCFEEALRLVASMTELLGESMQREMAVRLLPHVKAISGIAMKVAMTREELRQCLHVARFWVKWDISLATTDFHAYLLRECESEWGLEDLSTLDAASGLGILYSEQGRLPEAEELFLRTLNGRATALGSEHPLTLSTLSSVGTVYIRQRKVAQAEGAFLRAVHGQEKVCGPMHESTLMSLNNLGAFYTTHKKLELAEVLFERALQGTEETLGVEHRLTLFTVANLGGVYRARGRFTEADAMYRRALRGHEKLWGTEHFQTLKVMFNLGTLYLVQGQFSAAEELLERVHQAYVKTLGLEHPDTLQIMFYISQLYGEQGKIMEAEQICQATKQSWELGGNRLRLSISLPVSVRGMGDQRRRNNC